jgi:hypothetical protein
MKQSALVNIKALLFALAVLYFTSATFGQKLSVKIIHRQESDNEYTYVVPGYSSSTSNASVNCSGDTTVNCNGSSQTSGISTPAHEVSYHVTGATFTLLVPDGRRVIVNCDSKFAEHFAGRAGNKRSCRVPLVDDVEAEFDGDKAKLKWNVSLDGKKSASETYKILAVLSKNAVAQ